MKLFFDAFMYEARGRCCQENWANLFSHLKQGSMEFIRWSNSRRNGRSN